MKSEWKRPSALSNASFLCHQEQPRELALYKKTLCGKHVKHLLTLGDGGLLSRQTNGRRIMNGFVEYRVLVDVYGSCTL